ncbi:MAG TPA: glycogen debranching protein GlgX [Terriglobales bacterium]|nr:glycogen debranching protein GlgX [Terriglobales bacterium]
MPGKSFAKKSPKQASTAASEYHISRGVPLPLGATIRRRGVNFSIFSRHATACTLVLFQPGAVDPYIELPLDPRTNRTGQVWHMFVEGLDAGVQYGYRFDMQPNPNPRVYRFDPARVLLDPYARALSNGSAWGAHRPGERPYRNSLLVENHFDWEHDQPLNTPLVDSIIYEMHVRSFTQDPSSGVEHRGTFAGLIEKIPYLQKLGVTAVELLPVNEFEESDTDRVNPFTGEPLRNLWGYQPTAFFAPHSAYSSNLADGEVIHEFKRLVRAMHRAGIEVILDMVFNHTAEGDEHGPTWSFRGIDNPTYYILDPSTGKYENFTGCGNTVNCNNPVVRDFIVDCLHYWVMEMHVDGFRFDLASILGRGQDGTVLKNPPLLESLAYDPVLANTKLIAEAWDAAGLYQVGSFPSWGRWAEWNGIFRDDVRKFVKGDAGMTSALATRLVGSPDLYLSSAREPYHSINFVTCHDGFTLRDLVSYNEKHNLANGENNADGNPANYSWNCGVEGPTDDAAINELRLRQQKNFAAILLLSHGVPMILAGDEIGRTQQGNNNAYCQDNEISWLDWRLAETNAGLLRFFRLMIAFRKRCPLLRRSDFQLNGEGGFHITWHGVKRMQPDWSYESRSIAMQLTQLHPVPSDRAAFVRDGMDGGGRREDLHFIANAYSGDLEFELPQLGEYEWFRLADTAQASPLDIAEEGQEFPLLSQESYLVKGRSVAIFVSK